MDKVAVITGSSGGIGRSLVKTYLDSGYFVIGLDKNSVEEPLHEALIEIDTSLLLFSKDELYRAEIISKITSMIPSTIGKLVIINNAAEQVLTPVPEIEWKDWESSFAVNTVAPFFLVQGLIALLKLTKGHVINISSIHARLTKANFSCYAASKAALESVTRSLALELSAHGIAVNAIAPAAVSTDMLKAGFLNAREKLRELEEYHPAKTIGTPEQVSELVKAISDQEGGFLTGGVFDFNGGIGARLHDPS
jgi:NAD(P)-dependent dehydrogenase (short-subunit alcohol dehydrogenase family)